MVMDSWIYSQVESLLKDMLDQLETAINTPPGQSLSDSLITFAVESLMDQLLNQLQHLVPNSTKNDISISIYDWTKEVSTFTIDIEAKEVSTSTWVQTHDMSTSAGVDMSPASTLTQVKILLDQSTSTDTWTFETGTMTEKCSSLLVDSSTSPKMKFQFAKKSPPPPEGRDGGGRAEDKENRGLMESVRRAPALRLGLSRRVAKPLHQIYKTDDNGNGMEN